MNDEYESALRRAFVEHRADFVVITNRREQFQIEATNYGVDQGWLHGEMSMVDKELTQSGPAFWEERGSMRQTGHKPGWFGFYSDPRTAS